MRRSLVLLVAVLLGTCNSASNADVFVGFDGGDDGGFTGNAFFEAAGGNPGGNAHHLGQFFFPEIRTGAIGETTNPGFLGDFSSFGSITVGFDLRTDSLTDFIGNPIVREIGIKFIDRDIQGPSGSSGLYFGIGLMNGFATPTWESLSVTIDDPTSTTLPPGWIGFGDEDPVTFEPILPPGATFASVLAGVDEFHITGAVPGFFFTFANFDARIDNVFLTTIPEPAAAGVAGLVCGLSVLSRRRRRVLDGKVR